MTAAPSLYGGLKETGSPCWAGVACSPQGVARSLSSALAACALQNGKQDQDTIISFLARVGKMPQLCIIVVAVSKRSPHKSWHCDFASSSYSAADVYVYLLAERTACSKSLQSDWTQRNTTAPGATSKSARQQQAQGLCCHVADHACEHHVLSGPIREPSGSSAGCLAALNGCVWCVKGWCFSCRTCYYDRYLQWTAAVLWRQPDARQPL